MGRWNAGRVAAWTAGSVVALLLMAWGGWHAFLAWREREFISHFKDPPAGPRAPHSRALGLVVGRTTLDEALAHAAALGVTCMDTSTRAIMGAVREQKEKAFMERLMRGEFRRSEPALPDGYGKKLVGYMANPQVRMACDTRESVVTPGASDLPGRWLLIFDHEDFPMRHASFRLSLVDPAVAAERWRAAVAEFSALYGPPHDLVDRLVKDPDGRESLPLAAVNRARWNWADLSVEVTGVWLGQGRSASVEKRVEVPVGIRPDAPATPAP